MDADEFKVVDVLSRNERFVVPLYQRQYQWHDSYDGARAGAFWNDVSAKAGDVLNGTARFEHYMGALLLAPGATKRAYGMTPTVQVVDGQQRLTTFLLLLCAIREVALGLELHDIAEQCGKLIFNEPGKSDKDELVRFKLTPTPVDRSVFLDILDKPLEEVRQRQASLYWGLGVPKNTKARSLRVYEFFVAQVRNFAAEGPGDDIDLSDDAEIQGADHQADDLSVKDNQRRLAALLEALVFHLKLIVITLGEEDDAQVIFETLNSAGQPLLAMDLVRNNIFHRAEAELEGASEARQHAERIYRNVWQPFDDGWWREPAPNARPRRPRIDHFLAHVLTAETGERTTVRELYSEYRAWAAPKRQPRFERVEDELAVLQRHAPTYQVLEGRVDGDGAISWLGRRLNLWQNTTAYPVAFQIAGQAIPSEVKQQIACLIDSYLVRRLLCDLTSKNLNRVFPRLAAAIHALGPTVETVQTFFKGLTGDATRFPDDTELSACIGDKRAYGRIPSRFLADIFWSLELASRTKMTEATARPSMLWVEHVMPQSWEENWPLNDKSGDDVSTNEPAYWEREAALQTLGNLTIVTDSLNSSMGKLPFKQKAAKLIEHSNLTLNKRIAEQPIWTEDQISARGKELALLASKVWPSLDQ